MRAPAVAVLLCLATLCCGSDPARRAARDRLDALYEIAERHFSRGADREALEAFERFGRASDRPDDRALATYRRAEVRERMGDLDEAERLYEAVERSGVYERQALAAFRRARLQIEGRGRVEAGRGALRALVSRYPDSVAADKAVRDLAAAPPRGLADPRALLSWLRQVVREHPTAQVADNAQWHQALVEIYQLGDLSAGRATLRAFARWPESPLADDALWTLGALYRRQGAWARAVAVYESLLHIRNETSYLVGSYRGHRLDDAALMIADVHYHARRDFQAAAAAYQRLLDNFESSVTRDDAWWGLALSRSRLGDGEAARAALERLLAEQPESRHAGSARRLLAGDLQALEPADPGRVASPLLAPGARADL